MKKDRDMLVRSYPLLKLLILALGFSAMMLVRDAAAAEPADEAIGRDAALEKIENYFNSIDTLKADFVQVSPDGSVSDGRVYIKRPGYLRVEYDPPIQFLIVGDGRWLNMVDYEMQDVSRWAIDDTPLKVLVKDNLNLEKDVKVRAVETEGDFIRLTVSSPDVPGQERIRFTFTQDPMQLRQWEIADGSGQTTRVGLMNVETGVALSRDLFTFEDPGKRRFGPRR